MKHIGIEEVSKILGGYDKLANKVANNELEVCYRLNTLVASVDIATDKVNSIQAVDDFFIAEKTEELINLIKGNAKSLKILATAKALTLKHSNSSKNSQSKWIFLENNRTTWLLRDKIENNQIIYVDELLPEEIFKFSLPKVFFSNNECTKELDKDDFLDQDKFLIEAINRARNYGAKNITREDLFISKRSWNAFKRNPKTNTALDRAEYNYRDDLHQLILILKHIILETSGATQDELNDQVMNLLQPKGTKLHASKINRIFSEANKHKIETLRKNLITIFD